MLIRNLVFIGLIVLGCVLLGYLLFPEEIPQHAPHFDPEPFTRKDFRDVVQRVDASFQKTWHEQELEPAQRAPDLQIARRVSLALTGSIPSLQEIRQFESYDGPERLQWWLDGLLHDRRFGDYFAERLARVYVGTEDGPFLIYRRRRFVMWLSDQLMNNTRYDALVRELITARGLWTDQPEANFITVTVENGKPPDAERLAARTARAFLGLRIDCAQCHNHPFQDWKQADFQGLAAFYGQTHVGLTGVHDRDGDYQFEDRRTGAKEIADPRVPFETGLVPTRGTRRHQLAEWVTSPRNPYFGPAMVNRVWALMFGKPLVEPIDDLMVAVDRPAALDILAEDFVTHGYDLQRLIRLIAATQVYQVDSGSEQETSELHDRAWALFPLTRLRPEQVIGSVLQASQLETLNSDSHIIVQLIRATGQNDFIKRYGDTGDDEFDGRSGTIPQRLLMMNGNIVNERIKDGLFNASTRISMLAPTDRAAVETAFLCVLTRRPTAEEIERFEPRLKGTSGDRRTRVIEDLSWTLLNVAEFSWNH